MLGSESNMTSLSVVLETVCLVVCLQTAISEAMKISVPDALFAVPAAAT